MMIRRLFAAVLLGLCVVPASAQDRLVRIYAPAALVDSGLFKYAMPRFSLKTQIKVELVDAPDSADLVFGSEGRALFEGLDTVWSVTAPNQADADAKRLNDWLTSDVGMRTITSFAPDGAALFAPPSAQQRDVVAVEISGDAVLGLSVSQDQCARCHAVDEATRKKTIGSTPSFFVLRAMGDWEERFAAFYALNPHPAFTQIEDVTPPFPIDRPSPIAPIALSISDLEAVMAYVSALAPADLGAPLNASEF